jgi:hypothetical protein
MKLKRLIAAVSLSVLVVPAFAASEENDERARAFFKASAQPVAERSSPRAEKRVASNVTTMDHAASPAASAGKTAGDRGSAIDRGFRSPWATGPWANDHHFIAPAQ